MTKAYRWKRTVSYLLIGASLSGCSVLNLSGRTALKNGDQGLPDAAQLAAANQNIGSHLANKAQAAMAAGKMADAISWAEAAVAAEPMDGAYRSMLGQAYLQAGRFSAAVAALEEAAELGAMKGDAVVALALAKIAEGDPQGAVEWLSDQARNGSAEGLTASDLGLALSLAGDHAGALYMLRGAVQQPEASVQTRQNLSLALALAGQWAQARMIAAQDLPMNRVEKRMLEFSSLASTPDKKTQIADLMGIKMRSDAPMPAQLALRHALNSAAAVPERAAAMETGKADVAEWAVAAEREEGDTAPQIAEITPDIAAMVAALDDEIVRPMEKVAPREPQAQAMRALGLVARNSAAQGHYSVQIASLNSEANAKLAWQQISGRYQQVARFAASVHRASIGTRSTYRLTLDGFSSQKEAQKICAELKAQRQDCFVRQMSGRENILWAVGPHRMQLALR